MLSASRQNGHPGLHKKEMDVYDDETLYDPGRGRSLSSTALWNASTQLREQTDDAQILA